MEQLDEALNGGDDASIDAAYRSLTEKYPTSSLIWNSFAQWKYLTGDYSGLETIFGQTLKSIPSVKLWKLYLTYLRSKLVGSEDLTEASATLTKAYESAVIHVGLDVESFPLWFEYIEFTKSLPTTTFFEQQQVMDTTRRLYQRSLLMPVEGIEQLWSSYDAFENGLNKLTAKKMLSDRSPAYMLARSLCKELKDHTVACDREALPSVPQGDSGTGRLLAFMNWIAWEKANPLKIAEGPVLHARVNYAYKCAISSLRHYPEVAFDYARYLAEKGLGKEAEAVLKTSISTTPCALLTSFALADHYEATEKFTEGKEVYEELVKVLESRVASFDGTPSIEAQQATQDLTLAYIQYMHFSRRSEGINPARAIFTRARKLTSCTPQLFIAAARMEYHCKKDPVIAGKIFELGMARFGSSVEYVSEYLHHLILLNDDTNTRALFERALQSITSADVIEIWKLYLDYEFHYGDSKTINSLEKRFKVTFSDNPISKDISLFARRFGYGDLQPAEERVWTILQATPNPTTDMVRTSKPKLCFATELVTDLALRLPPAHMYTGPGVEPELLVRLLQTAADPQRNRIPDVDMTRDTHTRPLYDRKDHRDRGSGKDKKSTKTRERDSRRDSRGGDDRRDRRGTRKSTRSKSPPSRSSGTASRQDDIFEQRYLQREADRK